MKLSNYDAGEFVAVDNDFDYMNDDYDEDDDENDDENENERLDLGILNSGLYYVDLS